MKKLLLLVLLTSMFGTAHATRSRMNSLGQDANQGSFYLMDNRDFFRNPANVGKMRNFMVAELANGNTDTGIGNNLEGGYFGEFSSDMAFGVYLGKQAVAIDTFAAVVTGTDVETVGWPTSGDANPLNLFLGGGSDMKWGINLSYAGSENETAAGKQEFSGFGLAAGIETSGGLQVYASYLTDESKNPTSTAGEFTKLESTPMTIGVIYALNPETTIFGQYGTGDTKMNGNGVAEQKFDSSQIVVGIGRIYELSPTARFNFDLSYNMLESENKSSAQVPGLIDKYSQSTLPLVIGLEADAAEWLILRASIKQNFLLGDYETVRNTSTTAQTTEKESATFGTIVNIGGTLHFGKLKIDGNLGSGSLGDQGATALLDTNNFFGQAAVTYMF